MSAARLTRAEKQARTRRALLDAAAEVFVERGFQGASVEHIAERAGYTRGAFYSNFATRESFAELLQEACTRCTPRWSNWSAEPQAPSLREVGEQLAAIQADPSGSWLFRLWLELLAHSSRDDRFRAIAAGFWSANRELTAARILRDFEAAGTAPPVPPRTLASAMIALDVGLALQHFVDPEAVPLTDYPDLYELLFEPHRPTEPD